MKQSLSALVFDFGGTLDGPGIAWYERFFVYVQEYAPHVTWKQFLPFVIEAGRTLALDDRARSLSLEHTVEHLVRHVVNQRNPELEGVDATDITRRFLVDASAYLERSREVLQALSTDYRLACISNNWGNAEGWCQDLGFDQYFELVIDSTLVNVRKPDAKIFQIALEKMNLPAEKTAYVGDQFVADVLGSKSVGMMSVWLQSNPPKPCPDASKVDWCITQIEDLLELKTMARISGNV